jgi:hypothetical protein
MGKRAVFAVTGSEALAGPLAFSVVALPPAGFEGCEHPESNKMSEKQKVAAVSPVANHVLGKGTMASSPSLKCYTQPRQCPRKFWVIAGFFVR